MVATKSLKITTRGSAGSINEREFLSSLPDIQTMLSYLDGSETLVKKKWLNQISDMLKLLVDKWTMNYDGLVDDLENMMIYLSDLTQDCLPARMQLFASNPQFLRSILILVNSWLSVEDKTSSNALNFHRCRHLGVFVLLGLINGKSLCETFLQTVDHFDLFSHFKIFPDLFLTAEIQFTTQEMILEIFCRIYLMYLRNDNSKALLLLQHFPLHQKNSFLRMGPKSILKNMRLYLNEINETNPNITSVALVNASCLFNHSPVKSQLGKTDYADFGMEFFTFYLEESSLISINYKSLQNFYPTKANLQIKLSLDKDISELTKFIPPNTSTLCLVLELRSELEFNKVVAILEEKTYTVNGNGGCSQFQTLIDEELSPILRKREHTKITTTHHEDQPVMKMAEKTVTMTRPEVLKPAKRLKKTVEIPDLSSSLMLPQPPGENSLPL